MGDLKEVGEEGRRTEKKGREKKEERGLEKERERTSSRFKANWLSIFSISSYLLVVCWL